jgi:hypothetical protein
VTRDAADLELRCSCGALRGVVRGLSASTGNRVVCYCADCQSFAHFLGRAGEILDAHGGTDVVQTSPARVAFTQGREKLACMRLTPKGLHRWYADCCKTPIGNTLGSAGMPFVGLICACLGTGGAGPARDAALGPVRARVNVGSAKRDAAAHGIRSSGVLSSVLHFARLILAARLRGDQKASPFFDARTGRLVVAPRVLSDAELADVVRRREAF